MPRIPALLSILVLAATSAATGQTTDVQSDSTVLELRAVLRAFYFNLETENWDALASYVLSPKLMERRGVPTDSQIVLKDRTRSRTLEHAAKPPSGCPAPNSVLIDDAAIRVDGDWADVSVPRCHANVAGVDELRLMYFERRWRFIYTDLF